MRTRLIAGNWKMNKTASEAGPFVCRLLKLLPSRHTVEIILAPPFTALQETRRATEHTPLQMAAQNCHWQDCGAFTGEVSPPMLVDLGCRYVIVGHSERRKLFGEENEDINKKVHAAFRNGLRPILCVGETLLEREDGRTGSVVTEQLEKGTAGVAPAQAGTLVVAYEPVWAIGTGRAATPAQAQEVHALLRTVLARHYTEKVSQEIRILYGGSVTPENAGGFFAMGEVDGALVGGACLDPVAFANIITLAGGK